MSYAGTPTDDGSAGASVAPDSPFYRSQESAAGAVNSGEIPLPPPVFINPTGGDVRGDDRWGSGGFGENRKRIDGSIYAHQGQDYDANAGQDVSAVIGGQVNKIGYPYADGPGAGQYRYVEISDGNGNVVRQFYVQPNSDVKLGSNVSPGQVIGTAQDLQPRYPGITDHVHVEIRQNGSLVDPRSLIGMNGTP